MNTFKIVVAIFVKADSEEKAWDMVRESLDEALASNDYVIRFSETLVVE